MVSMKEMAVRYSGIQSALQELRCKQCDDGPVVFKEDLFFKHGQSIHVSILVAVQGRSSWS